MAGASLTVSKGNVEIIVVNGMCTPLTTGKRWLDCYKLPGRSTISPSRFVYGTVPIVMPEDRTAAETVRQ